MALFSNFQIGPQGKVNIRLLWIYTELEFQYGPRWSLYQIFIALKIVRVGGLWKLKNMALFSIFKLAPTQEKVNIRLLWNYTELEFQYVPRWSLCKIVIALKIVRVGGLWKLKNMALFSNFQIGPQGKVNIRLLWNYTEFEIQYGPWWSWCQIIIALKIFVWEVFENWRIWPFFSIFKSVLR